MNLLYVFYGNIDDPMNSGIVKKLTAQLKVFNNNGIETTLLAFDNGELVSVAGNCYTKIISIKENKHPINLYLFNRIKKFKSIFSYIKMNKPNILYIRYPYSTPLFINFLKKSKKYVNKIILDIPTYPYTGEFKGIKGNIFKTIDGIFSHMLKKYVNIIVSPTDYSEIFGIPTIKINNGIDINNLPVSKTKQDSKVFNIIGVASVSFWHGYDRVIIGLKAYYSKENDKEVFFHVIGDGSDIPRLKSIAKNCNLEQYVIFHGPQTGKELDNIFDISNVGIGDLAVHRKGLYSSSALKNREYCARGIPFVIASIDMDFKDDFRYIFKILPNESPVNIDDIIKFYFSLDIESAKRNMREYAEQKLTWEVKLKPVINYIMESCKSLEN